ncbi:TIGR03086 family protein [Streptoalloteichus tenebrarius]|uniref:TIGR03086 family protein n=1 Tax=Streptoalloteichus tenebrarius (strain ATCC 17920 / DSM 40477 / JCM 4838 / CBS 697.72 / NBRC 16177 / NCIMB 11028 / NRRL B-12390 / A12253. 1 / ISP 5477) TaxID=1933 RepID=A0ABT1HQT5_STRSD|nr:TIGR03086 family metal-binding protein [Streptoalloteichus tenebrarius]MCP2257868.1 TIGR03086 family protein [Streptoalloteichus tenebrarius]BFE99769.1 TIGR03086 family metal-binding protein [Streptoalloteichus tenebrarius]
MDLLVAYDRALDEFGRRVHRVSAERWNSPTPCVEWSVRDLVNHLTVEQLWAPWLLRGATLDEVGDRFDGDQLGDDPVRRWDRAARGSREAFHRPGALDGRVHTSAGVMAAADYGWQMTCDLTVHAWDLARGIGDDDRLDEELVDVVYETIRAQIDSWRGAGIVDPPVKVPDSAPTQDRLMGLVGRRP